MNINDLVAVADRIDQLIRRADTFGKSREDILMEMLFISEDLRTQADRIESQMIASMPEADIYGDNALEQEF